MKWINESWESRWQLQPPRTFLSVWWWELFQQLRAAAHVLLYLFWGQRVDEELRRRQQSGEGVCQQEQVHLQGNDNTLPRTSVCWIHQSRSDSSDNIPRSALCEKYSLYLYWFFFLSRLREHLLNWCCWKFNLTISGVNQTLTGTANADFC